MKGLIYTTSHAVTVSYEASFHGWWCSPPLGWLFVVTVFPARVWMVLMIGLLIDMNQMKAVSWAIFVNHWFPSDLHALSPERLKLACKLAIELFSVSFSSYLYLLVHVPHLLIPTLICSQKSQDIMIRCGQLRDQCSQQNRIYGHAYENAWLKKQPTIVSGSQVPELALSFKPSQV